jgi:UDPglucose 6-dehydrogenase
MIGSGYVGLVSGACFSDFGWEVTCVDQNQELIKALNEGNVPIYEPGLNEMVSKNVYYKRLRFTDDLDAAIHESEVVFIAVGTPQHEDGSAELHNVYKVARRIGEVISDYKVIVNKSTVPVGTANKVEQIIRDEIQRRGIEVEFDVVSNPEFLRQGSAIQDFTHADRVIIGAESEQAIDIMKEIYRVLYLNETPFLIVNPETSELIKYASNAFLATKISFINEISELCEKVGANVQHVAKGMGMDGRIGSKFLNAGPGYGGSCFPKDTKALVYTGEMHGCHLGIVKSTIEANDWQKYRMVEKVERELGSLEGKTIGILGLAFKNNTDDIREAPSLTIISELAARGASLKVYDPKAMIRAKERLEHLRVPIQDYCGDEYDTCRHVDAVILMTEWNQFRSLNFNQIKAEMKGEHFFDFKNIYSSDQMSQLGFQYFSVGRS